MAIHSIVANYQNPEHCQAIVALLNEYACDPMGGGEPLTQAVKAQLPQALSQVNGAFSILCYHNNKAVGLANCFEGFSTFACKPLINIHDLAVSPSARGLGISQLLLQHIEQIANERKCCKITLEVLAANHVAKAAYTKYGFAPYSLDAAAGEALFWQKAL